MILKKKPKQTNNLQNKYLINVVITLTYVSYAIIWPLE